MTHFDIAWVKGGGIPLHNRY